MQITCVQPRCDMATARVELLVGKGRRRSESHKPGSVRDAVVVLLRGGGLPVQEHRCGCCDLGVDNDVVTWWAAAIRSP